MTSIVGQHKFRDEAPNKPPLKIKCSSCGCWAKRGGSCYHCGTRATSVPPSTKSAAELLSRSPSAVGTIGQHLVLREEGAISAATPRASNYHAVVRNAISTPRSPTPLSMVSASSAEARASSKRRSEGVLNHRFREESSKAPQEKIKCTSCGCWATRGGTCYFCNKPQGMFPPSATSASSSISRLPTGESTQTPRASSPSRARFREESAKAPQLKVKCGICGCWAPRGGVCYFCKEPVKRSPPSAASAADSIARSPSGLSMGSPRKLTRSKSSCPAETALSSPRRAPSLRAVERPALTNHLQPPVRSSSTQGSSAPETALGVVSSGAPALTVPTLLPSSPSRSRSTPALHDDCDSRDKPSGLGSKPAPNLLSGQALTSIVTHKEHASHKEDAKMPGAHVMDTLAGVGVVRRYGEMRLAA